MIARLAAALSGSLDPEVGIVVLREVGSTNDLARRIVGEYVEDGTRQPRAVVVALSQLAGRGRTGRRWESPPSAGLYCSLLRALPPSDLSVVPLALANALGNALAPFLPEPPKLKWPNDILVPEGKVAGILVEAVRRGGEVHGLVGVGVNLALAPSMPTTAAALGGGEHEAELVSVATAVVTACWHALRTPLPPEETIARWQAASQHRHGDLLNLRVEDNVITGRYLGLAPDGRLALEVDGVRQLFSSGVLDPGLAQ